MKAFAENKSYNIIDLDLFVFQRVDRCANPVYRNTALLNTYLSAIETVICHRQNWFNKVSFSLIFKIPVLSHNGIVCDTCHT